MKFKREKEIGLKAVAEAVRVCINVQRAMLGHVAVVKEDRTPVTVADFGCQAVISRILTASLPDIRIMAEEQSLDLLKNPDSELPHILKRCINEIFDPSALLEDICQWIDAGPTGKGSLYWLLDPIDGTKGFLRGEQYAVALALIVDKRVELGFLGCPNLQYDENKKGCLFMAARGYGATQIYLGDMNMRRNIRVSARSGRGSLRFVESVEQEHADQHFHMEVSRGLGIEQPPLRIDSQAKYAVVARGEASAYLRISSPAHPNYKQKAWDHAAGFIIVEEAGGRVSDSFGVELDFSHGSTLKSNNGIVASNGICHDDIIAYIRDVADHMNKTM